MIINQTAEYALRATAILAAQPEGSRMSAIKLSEKTGVPLSYLSKILRKLVIADILYAQKGNNGGFRLNHAPKEISYLQVLEAVGCTPNDDHCVFGFPQCDPSIPCPLHDSWTTIREATFTWASEHTLQDTL